MSAENGSSLDSNGAVNRIDETAELVRLEVILDAGCPALITDEIERDREHHHAPVAPKRNLTPNGSPTA